MIKLSDYVMRFLVERGVGDLFLLSGGGIMHLVDSAGRTPGLRYWCNYHEQASAIAAEGYARMRAAPGACLATTGPGSANLLSGVAGAWMDSVPLICLGGQVRTGIRADFSKIRQSGPQEGNNLDMARPITKYAVCVTDPARIRHELERAWHEAVSGRPGPVFLEIPLDVQAAEIDPDALEPFVPPAPQARDDLSAKVAEVAAALARARRPLFLLGNGVRWARALDRVATLLEKIPAPVIAPFSAKDLVPEDHPLNMGIFGTAGQRRANFALQGCDCLVAVGAGLSITKMGFAFDQFAPKAVKIAVDVEPGQIFHQPFPADIPVVADAGEFFDELLRQSRGLPALDPRWGQACRRWKERYSLLEAAGDGDADHVNSYAFVDRLAQAMAPGQTVVTGNGLDCVSIYQSFRVKPGQRVLINGNWGAMGWDLPAAVGACVGGGGKRTVCVTGDGSLELNVQELLTIGHNRLPIKIFVLNNRGYSSIRGTQTAFFEGHFVGADPASGVGNPDFSHLAKAYGLAYDRIDRPAEVDAALARVLSDDAPALCEVNVSPMQWISPKASSFRRPDGTMESRPLEDMAPFLPREEVWENKRLFDD